MKQEQFAALQPQTVIPLPPRTRGIIEKKLSNKAALVALVQAEEKSVDDLIAAAREMLGVPDGWTIQSTETGFVAPPAQVVEVPLPVAQVVEVPAGDIMAEPESIEV